MDEARGWCWARTGDVDAGGFGGCDWEIGGYAGCSLAKPEVPGVGGGLARCGGVVDVTFEREVRAFTARAASADCWSISDMGV